jgi:hypothetical protein
MKTFKLSFMLLLLLGMAACTKNSNPPSVSAESSTDVAADLAGNSLAINSSGALSDVNDVTLSASIKIKVDSTCGTVWTDTVSRNFPFSNGYSYTYNANYSYTVNCTTNLFNGSVTSNGAYTSVYNGPNIYTTDSGSSDFTLGGLRNPAGVAINGNYTINGEYKRSGSFKSKIDSTYAGTHSTDIVITNLLVTKVLHVVEGGTATITITGDMPKRGNFTYTGTVVFNSDNTATLTLNGNIYTVNLITGIKIRR